MKNKAKISAFLILFFLLLGSIKAQPQIKYFEELDLFSLQGQREKKSDSLKVPCVKVFFEQGEISGWKILSEQEGWSSLTRVNNSSEGIYLSNQVNALDGFEYLTVKWIGQDTLAYFSYRRKKTTPNKDRWRLIQCEYLSENGESVLTLKLKKALKVKSPMVQPGYQKVHLRNVSTMRLAFYKFSSKTLSVQQSEIKLNDKDWGMPEHKTTCFEFPFTASFFWHQCSGIGKKTMCE